MIPLLIAGVLWIRPPHGIRRWLSLEATYSRQWSTHLRKNPLSKDTRWSGVHGRRFCHLMRAACRNDSCVVAAGNHLYVCGGWLEDHFVAKSERFDAVEINGRKLQTCNKKEGARLVWQMKGRFLWPEGCWKMGGCV